MKFSSFVYVLTFSVCCIPGLHGMYIDTEFEELQKTFDDHLQSGQVEEALQVLESNPKLVQYTPNDAYSTIVYGLASKSCVPTTTDAYYKILKVCFLYELSFNTTVANQLLPKLVIDITQRASEDAANLIDTIATSYHLFRTRGACLALTPIAHAPISFINKPYGYKKVIQSLCVYKLLTPEAQIKTFLAILNALRADGESVDQWHTRIAQQIVELASTLPEAFNLDDARYSELVIGFHMWISFQSESSYTVVEALLSKFPYLVSRPPSGYASLSDYVNRTYIENLGSTKQKMLQLVSRNASSTPIKKNLTLSAASVSTASTSQNGTWSLGISAKNDPWESQVEKPFNNLLEKADKTRNELKKIKPQNKKLRLRKHDSDESDSDSENDISDIFDSDNHYNLDDDDDAISVYSLSGKNVRTYASVPSNFNSSDDEAAINLTEPISQPSSPSIHDNQPSADSQSQGGWTLGVNLGNDIHTKKPKQNRGSTVILNGEVIHQGDGVVNVSASKKTTYTSSTTGASTNTTTSGSLGPKKLRANNPLAEQSNTTKPNTHPTSKKKKYDFSPGKYHTHSSIGISPWFAVAVIAGGIIAIAYYKYTTDTSEQEHDQESTERSPDEYHQSDGA